MWQDIQAFANYRTTSSVCDSDASLPDMLNYFYSQFEVQNNIVERKLPCNYLLHLTTLSRVYPWKAAGAFRSMCSVQCYLQHDCAAMQHQVQSIMTVEHQVQWWYDHGGSQQKSWLLTSGEYRATILNWTLTNPMWRSLRSPNSLVFTWQRT